MDPSSPYAKTKTCEGSTAGEDVVQRPPAGGVVCQTRKPFAASNAITRPLIVLTIRRSRATDRVCTPPTYTGEPSAVSGSAARQSWRSRETFWVVMMLRGKRTPSNDSHSAREVFCGKGSRPNGTAAVRMNVAAISDSPRHINLSTTGVVKPLTLFSDSPKFILSGGGWPVGSEGSPVAPPRACDARSSRLHWRSFAPLRMNLAYFPIRNNTPCGSVTSVAFALVWTLSYHESS